MQIYLTFAIIFVLILVLYYNGMLSTVLSSATVNVTSRGDTNGAAALNANKEKFELESNEVSSGETTTAQVANGQAITTSKPSDLLPSDPNASFAGVSGGSTDKIADQIIPAELMDPSRQPNYTSTTKSKIPNWQLRPDPPVDRSVVAGQFWNLTPDVQPDLYKSAGVEIKAVQPTSE